MAGRIRSIKPELLDDEIAAGLSDAAWRLFVSSWLLADDHGGFRASPRYLASLVWQDTSRDALTPLLELALKGRVLLYEVDGQLYGSIPNWARHQRVDNAGKPRVPPVPTNIREVSRRFAENLRDSRRVSATLGGLPLDHDPDHRPTINEIDPGFKTPPPSGAGPSPVLVPDPEPPASGAWAPVGPTGEAPAARPGGALETPIAIPDAPTHVGAPARPATSQPEPPTSPVPADLSPDAAATPAPLPEPDAPTAPVLPLSLAPAPSKHDPVVAIFEEYVAAWRKTTRGRRPPKLDDKRRRLTLARLRHFAEDDLKAAARGVFASRWHVEEGQTSYELVMRDAEHVERFMREDEATRPPPEPPTQGAPEWLTTAARPSPRVLETLRKMGPAAHGNLVGVLDDDIGTMEIT